ncbi:hypothetical protein KM043_005766 [Ampulex compressa]|nr:hypothetical protein KM043_005766 [Ampulex compressa]
MDCLGTNGKSNFPRVPPKKKRSSSGAAGQPGGTRLSKRREMEQGRWTGRWMVRGRRDAGAGTKLTGGRHAVWPCFVPGAVAAPRRGAFSRSTTGRPRIDPAALPAAVCCDAAAQSDYLAAANGSSEASFLAALRRLLRGVRAVSLTPRVPRAGAT